MEINVGRGQGEFQVDREMVKELAESIAIDKTQVAIFDPLISFHRTAEKSNENMRMVCDVFADVADRTGCAIEIGHHTRKPQPGQEELFAADARGASAIVDAVRSLRVLNRMSEAEARKLGVEPDMRRHYMRLDKDKANMTPANGAVWLRFESVILENHSEDEPGDNVGVVARWEPTPPIAIMSDDDRAYFKARVTEDRDYREDVRANHWVGHLIAERLSLDVNKPYDKACVLAALEALVEVDVFKVARRKDKNGQMRAFILPGGWRR